MSKNMGSIDRTLRPLAGASIVAVYVTQQITRSGSPHGDSRPDRPAEHVQPLPGVDHDAASFSFCPPMFQQCSGEAHTTSR
jgi:hypothetical protein